MDHVIGIDVGGSTTKIVGLRQGRMFSPLMVKASEDGEITAIQYVAVTEDA